MDYEIRPFNRGYVDTLCAWVRNNDELRALAPRTSWPLTPDKVFAWHDRRCVPLLLFCPPAARPIGYGELNRAPRNEASFWLGHIIVDPKRREEGAGTWFVTHVVDFAFEKLNAENVGLIVFPDNVRAIRCYLRSGFVSHRYEMHQFRRHDPRVRMKAMTLTRDHWHKHRAVQLDLADAENPPTEFDASKNAKSVAKLKVESALGEPESEQGAVTID